MHKGYFKNSSIKFIFGNAKFVILKTIIVKILNSKMQTLAAETIIISTGSYTTINNTLGLRKSDSLTHIKILEMDKIPIYIIIFNSLMSKSFC